MGIYTIPDGIVSSLHVQGKARFDGSANVAGQFKAVGGAMFEASANVTGQFQTATGALIDASAAIGNASTDSLSMFGDAGSVQQSTPDDAEVTASAITAATQLNLLLDRLSTAGILGGT